MRSPNSHTLGFSTKTPRLVLIHTLYKLIIDIQGEQQVTHSKYDLAKYGAWLVYIGWVEGIILLLFCMQLSALFWGETNMLHFFSYNRWSESILSLFLKAVNKHRSKMPSWQIMSKLQIEKKTLCFVFTGKCFLWTCAANCALLVHLLTLFYFHQLR